MRRRSIVAGATLLAVTAYGVADALDVAPGYLTTAPSAAAPPTLSPTTAPADEQTVPPVLAPPNDGTPTPAPATLARVLAPLVASPALGADPAVDVRDARTGTVLYAARSTRPATPASTTKIVTAAAVATSADLGATWRTRVVAGRAAQEVVLVAGGDNLLGAGASNPAAVAGRAGLADLATQTAAHLPRGARTPVRVVLDDSFAKGPPVAPGWAPADVSQGLTGPVAMLGLATDRAVPGRPAAPDPAMTAAAAFRAALAAKGVAVAPTVTRGIAPTGAAELGVIESAPIADVLALALDESDNDLTESVARWACAQAHQSTSFAGCAAWVQASVAGLGVPMRGVHLVDTSGLSRGTTIPAATLSALLVRAAGGADADLARVVAGLPVAGVSGTLTDRFRGVTERAGAGLVRAKTGTLTGVSSLAGTVVDADGRLLAFTVLADHVPPGGTLAARVALDRVATALAGCGCR